MADQTIQGGVNKKDDKEKHMDVINEANNGEFSEAEKIKFSEQKVEQKIIPEKEVTREKLEKIKEHLKEKRKEIYDTPEVKKQVSELSQEDQEVEKKAQKIADLSLVSGEKLDHTVKVAIQISEKLTKESTEHINQYFLVDLVLDILADNYEKLKEKDLI